MMTACGLCVRSSLKRGLFALLMLSMPVQAASRVPVSALYIPLADHYAGIVAYEKYASQMTRADYRIRRMESWDLLRAAFISGKADLAYIISPMALDMFRLQPDFRWIALMHRDGNALAINQHLDRNVNLPADRGVPRLDGQVAGVFRRHHQNTGQAVEVGVPHLLATHTVILHRYLQEHGLTLGLGVLEREDVLAVQVPPSLYPAFLRRKDARNEAAAFEQSLPWADVAETDQVGKIAWYSKDVLPWPGGHVACIVIARDDALAQKQAAIAEVTHYLHQAGRDIEQARSQGGEALRGIARMIRRHVPEHSEEAIIQSLRPDLQVINYRNLNPDLPGLYRIMELAVEAGVLAAPVDLEALVDLRFVEDTETGAQ